MKKILFLILLLALCTGCTTESPQQENPDALDQPKQSITEPQDTTEPIEKSAEENAEDIFKSYDVLAFKQIDPRLWEVENLSDAVLIDGSFNVSFSNDEGTVVDTFDRVIPVTLKGKQKIQLDFPSDLKGENEEVVDYSYDYIAEDGIKYSVDIDLVAERVYVINLTDLEN